MAHILTGTYTYHYQVPVPGTTDYRILVPLCTLHQPTTNWTFNINSNCPET